MSEESKPRTAREDFDGLARILEVRDRRNLTHSSAERLAALEALVGDGLAERLAALEALVPSRLEGIESQLDRRVRVLQTEAREHVADLRREIGEQQSSQKEAVTKAESAVDRRLEAMNEFRAALTDQSARMMLREVADGAFQDLRAQISELRTKVALGPPALGDLQAFVDRAEGGRAHVQDSRAVANTNIAAANLSTQLRLSLYAAAGLFLTIATIVVTIAIATHGFR